MTSHRLNNLLLLATWDSFKAAQNHHCLCITSTFYYYSFSDNEQPGARVTDSLHAVLLNANSLGYVQKQEQQHMNQLTGKATKCIVYFNVSPVKDTFWTMRFSNVM